MERGAVTAGYAGDVDQAVALLNTALATEIVCVLRYQYHAIMATGIHSEPAKREFAEHAADEQQHATRLAERISQLGGKPDMNPEGLLSRSHSEYASGDTLLEMLRENLVAERIAIDSYREMIQWFAPHDPTTVSYTHLVASGGDVRALVVALARSNAFRTRIVEDQ